MGRKSTLANAFVSALAPHKVYFMSGFANALRDLDQGADTDLLCVYCGRQTATWDHVFSMAEADRLATIIRHKAAT